MGQWSAALLAGVLAVSSVFLSSVATRAESEQGEARSVPPRGAQAHGSRRPCPAEMARVDGFCIDRWEIATVDRDTLEPLSPYYPPNPRLLKRVYRLWQIERTQYGIAEARRMPLPEPSAWQKTHSFKPKAVSRAGGVPQAYLTYYLAREVCENAGKRLCTLDEWQLACRGARRTKHPYGNDFVVGACNIGRYYHPAFLLHGHASVGHTDPRLNLVDERGSDPVLHLTGGTPRCVSRWGHDAIYDMEGNLDEWIEDEEGVFVGGFYARGTREGCDARISGHSPSYYDYSLGTRCCKDASGAP